MLSEKQIRKIRAVEGLRGKLLEVFTDYIIARRFTEGRYYVREWAQRFRSGKEWVSSDEEGQKILAEIRERRFGYTRASH